MTLVPRLRMSGALPPLPFALMTGHLYILLDQSSEEEME